MLLAAALRRHTPAPVLFLLILGLARAQAPAPLGQSGLPIVVDEGGEIRFAADFSGATPMSFRWRRDGVPIPTSGPAAERAGSAAHAIEAAQFSDAGTYIVEATNSSGTTASAPMAIVVMPARPPDITRQSGDLQGPLVETLDVLTTGARPMTFRWFRNGVELPNQTGSSLPLREVPGGRDGTYSVEVSNRAGRATSHPMRVSAAPAAGAVYIYQHPRHVKNTYGSGVTLEARLSDAMAARSYQWRRNGAAIAGATNFSHGVDVTPSSVGRYSVAITTTTGQTLVSEEAEVAITGRTTLAPSFLQHPTSQSLLQGDSTTLTAAADAGSGTALQWLKDGAPITGATGDTLFLVGVTPADAGRYRVMATQEAGASVSSNEALITVGTTPATPTDPLMVAAGASRIITFGALASLSVQVAGVPTPSIQWLKNGTPVAGATAATLTFTSAQMNDAGTYVAVATGPAGSVRSGSFIVTIEGAPATRPIFTSWPDPKISVVRGGAVELTYTIAPNTNRADPRPTFEWRKNGVRMFSTSGDVGTENRTTLALRGVANSGISLEDAGTYSVIASNHLGSTASEPVLLEVRPSHIPGIYMMQPSALGGFFGAGYYINADGTGTSLSTDGFGAGALAVASTGNGTLTEPAAAGPPRTTSIEIRGDSLFKSGGGVIPRRVSHGPFAEYAGYWRGELQAPSTGQAHILIAANGDAVVMAGSRIDGVAMQVRLNSDGTLNPAATARPSGQMVDIRFNVAAGTFMGRAMSGNSPAISFAGTRLGRPLMERLVDIATRGEAGTDANALIAGFVISGSAPRQVLIRAAGPALGGFGLSGVLANPRLELLGASGRLAENDDWNSSPNAAAIVQASAQVGAFAFPGDSQDAAILTTLSPGAYSARVSGTGDAAGATGIALVEVYDAGDNTNPAAAPRLANLSTRGHVGSGDHALVAGIVVSGESAKRVLIRAVGPTLGSFGVGGALADPVLKLYRQDFFLQENDNWVSSAELASATARVGAFALPAGSKDAVLLVTLPPGNFTAQVTGARDTTGVALVEVYEVRDAP